jgi:hypothetical protein
MDELMVCVVLNGTPMNDAIIMAILAPISAANPL